MNTKYILNLILACFIQASAFGQGQSEIELLPLKACYTDGAMHLRWSPDNFDSWQMGANQGYEVIRVQLKDHNGLALSRNERLLSRDTIETALKPLSTQTAWESNVADIEKAGVGYQIYNTTNLDYQPSPLRNLRDAVKYQENRNSKLLFANLLADGGFDLACASGLGLVDGTVQAGASYRYMVTSKNADLTLKGTTEVSASGDALPTVSNLKGEGSNLRVNLSWSTALTGDVYTYYNIERSDNGGQSFVKVNYEPHIAMIDPLLNPDEVNFTDTIISNEVDYQYRVIGLSPFGFEGPPSDTITIRGQHPSLQLEILIDSVIFDGSQSIIVDWSSMDHQMDGELDHFNLFYSNGIDDSRVLLNQNPIPAQERVFVGPLIEETGYYHLEAVDLYGNVYTSNAVLGQKADSTPPAVPQGLSGRIWNDGRVELTWTPNQESDLEGYKVLYSNQLNGTFTQLTKDHVDSAYYLSEIDPKIAIDSIFFKVLAIDKRYNSSESSEALSMARPDLVPPAKSYLAQVIAKQEGIRMAWELSPSDDVVFYTVQRRMLEAINWEDVVEFNPNNLPTPPALDPTEAIPSTYLDEAKLENRIYVYRVLSEDESGNQSSSNTRQIRPFDDGLRGIVRGVVGIEVLVSREQVPVVGNNGSAMQGYSNIQIFPFESIDKVDFKEKAVMLTWEYGTEFPSSLHEFKVYRRFKSGQSSQSVAINVLSHPWVAVGSIGNREAEMMASLVNYNGYMFLDFPSVEDYDKYIDFEYKIIAFHSDGGFSEFSPKVEVRFE